MTNLIAKHGGYQMAQIVYDLTVEFVKKFVDEPYRTNRTYKTYNHNRQADQMLQAARSGKQNIAEGSQTSGTSKQSEIRLLTVARASFEELFQDFLDFLKTNNLPLWDKNDSRTLAIRKLAYKTDKSYTTYMSYLLNAETAANCILCVINQANYLLDRQMQALGCELALSGDFKDRYKEANKHRVLNEGPSMDEFLKSAGFKRLENGRVIGLNDSDQ